ncbi:uncharacterized protein Dana_GF26516 [Drosophila ananassae]|uniref:BPTI/Kunitz inhibitor domain-containing protein n=1 Tax=Drosophila ananassae TaxID=7217 RepID=A0A0P8XEK5_DROAN|nr:chymotrypsin inhibitor SCI-III [Drosophila ananassae]KPU73265.1 uncharacterized protein Dana_GF26516 [Drosophila ananassae]
MKSLAIFAVICVLFGLTFGLKDPICGQMPAANGFQYMRCFGYNIYYSYHRMSNECLPFNYGGCGGNMNKFTSKASCEEACKEMTNVFLKY